MARTKQSTPLKREPSESWIHKEKGFVDDAIMLSNGAAKFPENGNTEKTPSKLAEILLEQPKVIRQEQPQVIRQEQPQAGIRELLICCGGIYASFLTWALVQERITTTPYGPGDKPEIFDFSVFLNTIQSSFAALAGYGYLLISSRNASSVPPLFPTRAIIPPMLLVSITMSLGPLFGYASLKHVGYITFILAKSCKLLPVMALHVSVFRRRYPLYKYAVVALVTAGVAVFTLNHPSSSKKASKGLHQDASVGWGLLLLSINLLFDGLTNSTQDYINSSFAPYSGSQMMCAQNLISTLLTSSFLLSSPTLAKLPVANYLGLASSPGAVASQGELRAALAFLARHPTVTKDILLFAGCGAIGQIFIFFTLAKFSSLLLVTITVTRKMLTMLLSVVWFGHKLSLGQWAGVVLVFGGVGAEGMIGRWEKQKKEREKAKGRKVL